MAADDLGNPLKKKHGKGAKRFLPPQALPVAGGALAVLAVVFIWMGVAGNRGGGEPFGFLCMVDARRDTPEPVHQP